MEGDQNQVVVAPVTPEPDLITKVSQFKKEPVKSIDEKPFDVKDLDTIKDPVAKALADKVYKQFQADYTRKTQEVAEQRKTLEAKLDEMKNWTPERIQNELLNNPQFVTAASQIAGRSNQNPNGSTEEDYSVLSEGEKAKLKTLENELNQLKQVNHSAHIAQYDATLKSKYSDYDPVAIDKAIAELVSLSPAEIREYVYKAKLHDEHVKAAYEIARQERVSLNQEKIGALTTPGITATEDGRPVKGEKETPSQYLNRILQMRFAESRRR